MKKQNNKNNVLDKKLSTVQKKALKLILYGGKGIDEISEVLSISQELIYKWITCDKAFTAELEKGLSLNAGIFESLLKAGVPKAAETLNFLSKHASSESTRLSASKEIINYVKSLEDKNAGDSGELKRLIEGFKES